MISLNPLLKCLESVVLSSKIKVHVYFKNYTRFVYSQRSDSQTNTSGYEQMETSGQSASALTLRYVLPGVLVRSYLGLFTAFTIYLCSQHPLKHVTSFVQPFNLTNLCPLPMLLYTPQVVQVRWQSQQCHIENLTSVMGSFLFLIEHTAFTSGSDVWFNRSHLGDGFIPSLSQSVFMSVERI